MTPEPFLLIDLGNTSAKLRLATPTHLLGETRRVAVAELTAENGPDVLGQALAGWKHGRSVLSSVVPAATRVVQATLPDVFTIHVGTSTGVDLRGYTGRQTLGSDRLANLAGALALYGPPPLIVADFGTAATFNVLDARGRFVGGTIAPGLGTMTGYLSERTALLPPIRLAGPKPAAIGRSTVGALRAGALIGYRGLVREILGALRAELGELTARVIATGGDAGFIRSRLGVVFDAVEPDLTLHGLRVIAARHLPPTA